MTTRKPGSGGRFGLARIAIGLCGLAIVGGAALKLRAATSGGTAAPVASADPAATEKSMHEFTMKTIDGESRSLGEYRGQVVLVVNTASECGLTPQYEGLQKIHERFQARGFNVLGFPSNDFGGQEPGAEPEIKTFCVTKYGVGFPLFAKIPVKGPEKHPLYAWLGEAKGGDPKWNFTKFLIGKDGKVIERFEPKVEPEDPAVVAAIEKALAG